MKASEERAAAALKAAQAEAREALARAQAERHAAEESDADWKAKLAIAENAARQEGATALKLLKAKHEDEDLLKRANADANAKKQAVELLSAEAERAKAALAAATANGGAGKSVAGVATGGVTTAIDSGLRSEATGRLKALEEELAKKGRELEDAQRASAAAEKERQRMAKELTEAQKLAADKTRQADEARRGAALAAEAAQAEQAR
ncbi:hypothetical protein Ctob_006050 [Chrysochromulina tobinii]|uniref:Uncharacterized protein n=1 Tax=Chrysochromulina tobinii TaxID=1460289 RepID=A0A0M0JV60_9EUKA|nr:hypothetical protein Ctob_006050 [Chrysochromulina tobinii]|eukprot:KOO30430.1 hypothetical protein Ctob_006050 [Chrysochromulina sp. CCMP291]